MKKLSLIESVTKLNSIHVYHSRESGNPDHFLFKKKTWIPAFAGMTRVYNGLILAFLCIPLVMFANGGDQRIVGKQYLINLSRAPFTPRVGVQTSMLASFVDMQKDTLIAEDLIVGMRIAKLGGAGIDKRVFIFRKDGMAVKGGILELSYMFVEPGLHEIFFNFAFASNPQDVHEAPDFLIDVQSPSLAQIQNQDIIFLIAGGVLCGITIGWFMRRHYA